MLPDASENGGDLGTDFPLVYCLCGIAYIASLALDQMCALLQAAHGTDTGARHTATTFKVADVTATTEKVANPLYVGLPTHTSSSAESSGSRCGRCSKSRRNDESSALLPSVNSREAERQQPPQEFKGSQTVVYMAEPQSSRTSSPALSLSPSPSPSPPPPPLPSSMGVAAKSGSVSNPVATLALTFGLVSHSVIAGMVRVGARTRAQTPARN